MCDEAKTDNPVRGADCRQYALFVRHMSERMVSSREAAGTNSAAARRSRGVTALVCLLSATSLAGCTVGPDYRPPEIKLTAFHSGSAAAGTLQRAPALDSWWSGFNDPELTRIIARALSQNLDLSAALARVQQARAAAEEAGADELPIIGAEGSGAAMSQSIRSPLGMVASHEPGYFRAGTDYNLGLGATWELDLFGGLKRGAQASTAEAEAANATRLGVRVTVAADAADAYLQLRGIQVRITVAKQQIATDSELLRLVHERAESGASTQREIAQAQALLSAARATVPPLETALEAQLNRLDVLMGAQPGTYARELAAEQQIPTAPGLRADLTPAEMLRRRPDIIAAERRVAASNARIGMAVSEYYPKVSLAGLLGFESLGQGISPNRLFSAAAFQPQLTAGLRWRLFDFGRIDDEVTEEKSGTAVALAEYRQTVLRAAEDVENAFTAYVQLQAQMREISDEVNALRTAVRTSQEAYEQGSIPLTDVLDADRQLLAAQDQLAQARANIDRAAVASYRSMGGAGVDGPAIASNRSNVGGLSGG
jgi:NodT family efflux transporter outer membrane factor (OMF) lipoprotein